MACTYDNTDNLVSITYPDGISTYNTYDEANQITELTNICDDCGWVVSQYAYTYDTDGNLVSEIGKDGTDKVELTYTYTVENRLEAVYDKEELLMAAAYDGDGNRVFQLNYNLHTDEDWKGNSGNGNATNAETNNSQNQSGILFPIASENSDTESYLISLIKTTKRKRIMS